MPTGCFIATAVGGLESGLILPRTGKWLWGFTYEVRLTMTWEEWDALVTKVGNARAKMKAAERKGKSW